MTAKEFRIKEGISITQDLINQDLEELMIGFAKYHVEKAVEVISEKVTMVDLNEDCHYEAEDGHYPECWRVNKHSILTAYPLENIK